MLDRSFVVHALIATEALNGAARKYIERLIELETTVYFNRLLELEHRKDGRARRRAGRLLADVTREWERTLYIAGIMRRFGLGSYDAVHAATALYSQVPAILTVDTGFAVMPQSSLTIYTNATRLARCRAMRRRPSVTR